MNRIVLGKYVNTHGIKGEIRLKSNFLYKEKVFKIGNEIIIDKPYIINSYRIHKGYDMVTLKGIHSINDIIGLKGSLVYIDRDKYLDESEYLDSDLIGFKVYCDNKFIGNITDIRELSRNKKLIEINNKLIPFELIINVDIKNKIVNINYLEGLI